MNQIRIFRICSSLVSTTIPFKSFEPIMDDFPSPFVTILVEQTFPSIVCPTTVWTSFKKGKFRKKKITLFCSQNWSPISYVWMDPNFLRRTIEEEEK